MEMLLSVIKWWCSYLRFKFYTRHFVLKKLHQASYNALNRNHTSMLLKLTFLMILIVTLQIDLNHSYRYCKYFNINLKSSSKVKRCKAPVLLYANSVKSFNVILSSDIEKSLGPGSHPVKCDTCEKTIRSNSKKTYCTVCRNVTHLKRITSNKKISCNLTQDWMCSTCIQSTLPFSKVRDLHV